MPPYDLAILITVDICLGLAGIIGTFAVVWGLSRHLTRATTELGERMRDIATMQREVAFMIRRQYGDIDRDLQEIKELLGGQ